MRQARSHWDKIAAGLTIRDQAFIGGRFAASRADRTLPTVDPASGRVLAKVSACDESDVDRAVASALSLRLRTLEPGPDRGAQASAAAPRRTHRGTR
jgi:acyl-CoA reductase-like NAD-dependent aldehyde dehydrogenase